jgi:hypothetical protein
LWRRPEAAVSPSITPIVEFLAENLAIALKRYSRLSCSRREKAIISCSSCVYPKLAATAEA